MCTAITQQYRPFAGTASEDGALWRAASYVRLSKEDGDKEESDSIGNQRDLIQSYARSCPDIALAETPYVDDGYSGVNFDRPDFNRLLDDIKSGLINCVIVKDLSRLGRNYIETGKLLERFFPFMGVRFIAINDSYDSQNHNAQTDSLLIPFKNLINDAYCADTSRKIRSQLEVKREKGEFIGPFAAYGYCKDPEDHNRLLVDEPAAAVVRDIFRWKIDGMSPQAIADRLCGLGVPSPLEYKKQNGSKFRTAFQTKHTAKWAAVAVGRILKNELYIGVLTQGVTTTPNYKVKQRVTKTPDEWARVEGSHEAIVTAEDFALVASLLRMDTRAGAGETSVYLFSGMLVCADCGRNLVRKNVGKYVYHVCGSHKKGGACTSHSISDKALYSAVFYTLSAHIRECAEIGRVLGFIENLPLQRMEAQKLQRQIEGKQAEIEKLKDRKVKLHGDYSDGLMDKADYMDLNEIYSGQIKEAEAALARLDRELSDITENRTDKSLWIEHFKKYHNMQSLTRAAVVELMERIIVYEGGRIEVVPRYRQSYDDAVRYISSLPLDADDERRVG